VKVPTLEEQVSDIRNMCSSLVNYTRSLHEILVREYSGRYESDDEGVYGSECESDGYPSFQDFVCAGVPELIEDDVPSPRLVCIESNPGPPKRGKGKKAKKGKGNKGKKGMLIPHEARAVPGRFGNTIRLGRSPSMGFPDHIKRYQQLLNNPFDHPPVRVGVGCAVPTGLMTCYIRQGASCAASGNTAFIFYPGRLVNAPIMNTNQTTAPYTWSSFATFPQAANINSIYEKVRLIAAGVRIMPTQPSTADQGVISCGLMPSLRSSDLNNFGVQTTAAGTIGLVEYPSLTESTVIPFKRGASIFWRPQDSNSFNFQETYLVDTALSTTTLTGVPFMYAGLSGCAATAAFELEFIAHYEGVIAAGNAGVVDQSRSPATPDHHALLAADGVFQGSNRTGVPGTEGGFLMKLIQAGQMIGGITSDVKQIAGIASKAYGTFGSSVGPIIEMIE